MTGPMTARRAVLWDIGGPIDTEVAAEAMIDTVLQDVASRHLGRAVSAAEAVAASSCYLVLAALARRQRQ